MFYLFSDVLFYLFSDVLFYLFSDVLFIFSSAQVPLMYLLPATMMFFVLLVMLLFMLCGYSIHLPFFMGSIAPHTAAPRVNAVPHSVEAIAQQVSPALGTRVRE